MKFFLKILKWLFISILVIILGIRVSGNQFLLKGIWAVYLHGHKTASIDDARFFDTRNIETAQALPWQTAANYNQFELNRFLPNPTLG